MQRRMGPIKGRGVLPGLFPANAGLGGRPALRTSLGQLSRIAKEAQYGVNPRTAMNTRIKRLKRVKDKMVNKKAKIALVFGL